MKETAPVRIVILGGGFAGVNTAMELGRLTRRNRAIEVQFVSDENYFVFQPMLPEVVACSIEPSHILNPIRQLCKHVQFHCSAVQSIDTRARDVVLVGEDVRRSQVLPYDHLIVTLGLTMDLSHIPGMAEHSLPIKTLGDAFHLRNHVLSKLEEADIEPDEESRRQARTIVTVGGGFSGVKTIAQINDMIKAVLPFYPRARETGIRAVLIHSRDRILNELEIGLARFAEKKLLRRGAELILENRVKEATPSGIVLTDGTSIKAGTVICTVGNAPHPLIAETGFPQERWRVLVDEHLRVRGFDDIWALGDAAMVPDTRRGGLCPPTAQYAMRRKAVRPQCTRHDLRASDAAVCVPRPWAACGGRTSKRGRSCAGLQYRRAACLVALAIGLFDETTRSPIENSRRIRLDTGSHLPARHHEVGRRAHRACAPRPLSNRGGHHPTG